LNTCVLRTILFAAAAPSRASQSARHETQGFWKKKIFIQKREHRSTLLCSLFL